MSEQAQEKLFEPLQQSGIRIGLRNDKIALGGNVNELTDEIRSYLKEYLPLLSESAKGIQKQYDYVWAQNLSDIVNLTDMTQSGSLIKKAQVSNAAVSSNDSISAYISNQQELSEIEPALRAAWAVVLHRYTANERVSFLTAEPVPNHEFNFTSVLNPIVDYFDISADTNFLDLLETAVRNRSNSQGKGFPSQKLLEKTLFLNTANPSLFVIDNNYASEQLNTFFDEVAQHFIYAIKIEKQSDAIALHLHFDSTRATHVAAQRLLSYYTNIIGKFLNKKNLNDAISQHDFLAESDKTLLLEHWAGKQISLPKGLTIVHLFEQQVNKTPDAICLEEGLNRLTYVEVNQRINEFLDGLLCLGVQAGQSIGVHMSKSIDLVVACFAIMKAGCAYLPLDKSMPRERSQNICESAQIKWVLVDTQEGKDIFQSMELLHTLQVQFVKELDSSNARSNIALPAMCEQEHIAYIIYTSGSTGTPKGVAVSHRALISFLLHCKQTYSAEDLRSVLFSTRICFDLSIFELFSAFLFGGKLVIVEDILELVGAEEEFDVSFVGSVPSVMAQLLDAGDLPASVRTLNLGGEPLRRSLVERAFKQSAISRLDNIYGPTESTVFCTTSSMFEPLKFEPVIGKPVANTQALVLDPHGNLVPAGVVGELYLAGLNTANGYVNAENLTAERFKKGSKYFDDTAMYCTGDFVRWNDEGELEFIGRKDQQIKLRGFRIEIDEIEVALNSVPGVLDGAVILYKDEIRGDFLAAYVTVDNLVTAKTILDSLRLRLPEYMVPMYCIPLDCMPNTASGKIDRKNLAARHVANITSNVFTAPVTELQKNICKAFADTLGIKDVGIESEFFALGGHSLLIGKLVRKIHEYTHIKIPLRSIFDNPSVAQIERYLQKTGSTQTCENTSLSLAAISIGTLSDAEASFSQQAYWYNNQLRGTTAEYNLAFAFRVLGKLNEQALASTYDTLIRKHSVLRTLLYEASGTIRQHAVDDYHLPFTKIDMPAYDTVEATRIAAREIIELQANQPFNLERDCPTRLILVNITDNEQYLLLVVHHSAADGVAINNMFKELELGYQKSVGIVVEENQSPVCQFIHYSEWQQKWVASQDGLNSLNYWQSKLKDIPILHRLPTDFLRPSKQSHEGLIWRTKISAELTLQLKSVSSAYGASLFMGMQSAFAWLLARACNHDDVLMGTPSAGRDADLLETAIGNFMNTLVLRNHMPVGFCFSELLNQTKSTLLSAFEHQHVPIELLTAKLARVRDDSFNPLYQIWFVMQNQEREMSSFADIAIEGLTQNFAEKKSVHFDLSLSISEVNGNLELYWGYKDFIFKESTIAYLSDCYKKLLEYVVQYPEEKIPESITVFNAPKSISLANSFRINPDHIRDYLSQELDWFAEKALLRFMNNKLCISLISSDSEAAKLLTELSHRINSIFPEYLRDIYLLSSSESITDKDLYSLVNDDHSLEWEAIKQTAVLSAGWDIYQKDVNLYIAAALLFASDKYGNKFEIAFDRAHKIYRCSAKTGIIENSFSKIPIELDPNENLANLHKIICGFIGSSIPSKIYIQNSNDLTIGFSIADNSIEICIFNNKLMPITNLELKAEITDIVNLIENTAYIKIKDVTKYAKQNANVLVNELKSRFG